MICEFGDVAIVPFPFIDRMVSKIRPALVLSNETFNRLNGNTVLAMITTGAGSRWPSDINIADIRAAGLAHASLVRWKVFTLPNDLIGRVAGQIGDMDRMAVATAIRSIAP